MGALLSERYREAVLWQESAPAPAPLATELPGEVDVAVVGGGYCGLAAAAELAHRGRSVVVADRDELGSGASSRNGGMVLPELKAGPRTLERRYGELGLRMHRAVQEAFDRVEALVEEGIDCDYRRSGQLYLAHAPRAVPALESLAEELASVGSPARLLRGRDLAAEIGSRAFPAGLAVERSGGLHPARFHAGLARRAAAAGASLHPRTAVVSVRRHGERWLLTTAAGPLRAAEVLIATNAYADGLVPPLRRGVLPVGSFIIATEPLSEDVARSVLPTGRMAFDTKALLWYWRLGPGGRLLFGGRRRLGPMGLREARDHLYDSMLRAHPQLSGVAVERAWGGLVALTVDRLPHCGVIEGAWYATGCNGSGVALNTWMGEAMAAAICGAPLPAFAALAHRAVPLHRLARWWLPLASGWFRWQDSRR